MENTNTTPIAPESPMQNSSPMLPPVPEPKKSHSKLVILIIVIAVAVLALLAAAIYFWPKLNTQQSAQNTQDPKANQDIKIPETLDLPPMIDPHKVSVNENIKAKLGDQVHLTSGTSLALTSVDYAWEYKIDTTKFVTSEDTDFNGEKFIAITLLIGNREANELKYFSYSNFNLKNSEGQHLAGSDITLYAPKVEEAGFVRTAVLEPGQQEKGFMLFEIVPDFMNKTPISLVFEEEVWNFERDDTLSVVEIALP